MGRPKGSPNKRSQALLVKLENDHKFSVVNELIEVYGYNKQILCELVAKMQQNIEEEKAVLFGFSQDEITLYQNTNRDVLAVLTRLLSYLYPKLKALEVNTDVGDKVVFNISGLTGQGTIERPLPPNVVPIKQDM